jgi:hypothetical protein
MDMLLFGVDVIKMLREVELVVGCGGVAMRSSSSVIYSSDDLGARLGWKSHFRSTALAKNYLYILNVLLLNSNLCFKLGLRLCVYISLIL